MFVDVNIAQSMLFWSVTSKSAHFQY